jgi:hypothetical protein
LIFSILLIIYNINVLTSMLINLFRVLKKLLETFIPVIF